MKNIGMHALSSTLGIALALGAVAEVQAAATANFEGLCQWNAGFTQYACSFDARRPASSPSACPGSYVWKYFWDFDDGSTLFTGSPLVSHTFPDRADRVVGLRVICWNGEIADRLRHVCSTIGTPGCLQVNGGWN